MNVISRGVRNAFRNWIRSGSIVIILSLSIGLIIAMLAARQAVTDRIETVKSSVGNTVSISPAGVRGFEGGGEALTKKDVKKVAALENVTKVSSSLSDRLTTDDTTNLESGIELGSLGNRRANESNSANQGGESDSSQRQMPGGGNFNPMVSITVTGIEDATSQTVWGGSSVTWESGEAFDGESSKKVAVVGKAIAEKNDLKVGDTFEAYDTKLTVVGIYDAGTTFANNGVFVPLATLQNLSDQDDSITSMTATVDSVDNLSSATTAIQKALGDDADVTNNQETTQNAIAPLESVSTIAMFSLIGALVAGSIIILLTMIMIVRERRREIGVMKAIGSSNVGIVSQFVIESVTLTACALVVGLGIGVAASTPVTNVLVSNSSSSSQSQQSPGGMGGNMRGGPGGFGRASAQTLQNISSSVGVETIAYGLGATLLIAILGSAIPALLISKVKPAEAMRSE